MLLRKLEISEVKSWAKAAIPSSQEVQHEKGWLAASG